MARRTMFGMFCKVAIHVKNSTPTKPKIWVSSCAFVGSARAKVHLHFRVGNDYLVPPRCASTGQITKQQVAELMEEVAGQPREVRRCITEYHTQLCTCSMLR